MGQILKATVKGKTRSLKGEIKICNANGRIRLRWSVRDMGRFSYNTGFAYTTANLPFAEIKKAEIKLDIMKGTFNPDLYRKPKKKKNLFIIPDIETVLSPQELLPAADMPIQEPVSNFFQQPPVDQPTNERLDFPQALPQIGNPVFLDQLAEQFDVWVKAIRNISIDKDQHSIPPFEPVSWQHNVLPPAVMPIEERVSDFFEHPPIGETNHEHLKDGIREALPLIENPVFLHQLAGHFERWVKVIRKKNIDKDQKFKALRNKLLSWDNIDIELFPDQLANECLNPVTGNEYLSLYQHFCRWLVKHKKITANPLEDISRVRIRATLTPQKRKPLSTNELKSIFSAIKNNVYGRHHAHYFAWISFVFLTGARNNEAVGLRVSHVDFKKKKITICEALARSATGGTHSKARIRRETKGQNSRDLPMCSALEKILLPLCEGKQPDDLVFQSPNGLAINDEQVRKRVWQQVLTGLKIPYHVIYCARKTFADRAIDRGYSIKQLAYYFGHKRTNTTMRYYIEVLATDVPLPNEQFDI